MTTRLERLIARDHIVSISRVGAAVSLIAFGVAFFSPSFSFMLRLVAFFLLCLFSFHWLLGSAKAMTVTHSRLIDYVYLSIAAFGVFVLALNYEEKRTEYIQAERMEKLRNDLSGSRSDMMHIMSGLDYATCASDFVKIMPNYCKLVDSVDHNVVDETKKPDPSILTVAEYLRTVTAPDPGDTERTQAYARVDRLNRRLGLANLRRQNTLSAIEDQLAGVREKDVRESTYGLFTWPFILAFAFALRLTKTTIEVLDWAGGKRTTPAPTSSSAL